MKLLDFPNVVQRVILKQMDYAELIFLSMTSKRILTLTASVRRKELKGIHYESKPDFLVVSSVNQKGENTEMFKIYSQKTADTENTMEVRDDEKSVSYGIVRDDGSCRVQEEKSPYIHYTYQDFLLSDVDFVAEVQDMILWSNRYFELWRTPRWPDLVIYSDDNDEKTLQKIHRQIDRVFGRYVKYELATQDHPVNGPLFLPKFIKINKSYFYLKKDTKTQVLSEWFSDQPTQELVRIHNLTSTEGLLTNSKIFDVRTLVLTFPDSSFNISSFLSNFKGQVLIIDHAYCTNEDIIHFLDKWRRKQVHEHLQTLRVFINRTGSLNPTSIREKAQLKELSNDDRLTVDFADRVIYDDPQKKTVSLSSYIVRDDGMIAYVAITRNTFAFEVQNNKKV